MAERADELAERVKRALRAARDRRPGDERDHDFLCELSVDGLQALWALLSELEAAQRAAEWEQENGGCSCRTCACFAASGGGSDG